MNNDPSSTQRRTLLHMAGGLAALTQLGAGNATAAPLAPVATGKPGDFDFLSGHWKIKHRRLKDEQWTSFDGEATVHGILAGVASVEELLIPSQNFSGMGLRVLDVERKLWADYWVNSKSGIVGSTPSWGSFSDGVGSWDSVEAGGARRAIVRGVWDRITPQSCRWYQAVSRDEGKTWQENWVMHWQRV